MPTRSSNTAAVTYLDRGAVLRDLAAAAKQLTARDPNVMAVVLFGSLAHGTPTPSSDADLLLVVGEDRRRMIDRIPDYTRPFEAARMAIQVLPWTAQELERRLAAGDRFAKEILETGHVLAGTVPGPT